MRIQVLGSGYIGTVNAFCLMDRGEISVFDVDPVIQANFESRTPLFHETNFHWDVFFDRVTFEQLDAPDAIIVCVNAPYEGDGYNLANIRKILKEHSNTPVILRSTLGPREIDILSRVQHKCLYYWPEFLREGSAISDFHRDENFVSLVAGNERDELVQSIIGDFTMLSDAKAAASVKFLSNFYRALKVSFGNQIGVLLDEYKIDQDVFFDVFFRLRGNCDAMYLRPGPPFGGLCLPKETAMSEGMIGHHFDPDANLATAVTRVNEAMIRRKVELIRASGAKRVGISEFSFKGGTSDLRNSPTLTLGLTLQQFVEVFDLDGSSGGAFPFLPEGKAADFTFRGHQDW
jgi:nucleotide sugar dehydrogenase